MHGERAAAEPDTGQRLAFWMAFYALVVLAWLALWLMVQDPAALAARSLPALLADLCGVAAGDAGLGALYAMWAVMAAAMMAPTAAPALATWLALPPRASGGAAGTAAVLAGYLAVWAGAAAVLAGAHAWFAAGTRCRSSWRTGGRGAPAPSPSACGWGRSALAAAGR
jgi:predicted metal-binding membrane protein